MGISITTPAHLLEHGCGAEEIRPEIIDVQQYAFGWLILIPGLAEDTKIAVAFFADLGNEQCDSLCRKCAMPALPLGSSVE